MEKQTYVSPHIETVLIEYEGVMTGSAPGLPGAGGPAQKGGTRSHTNNSTLGELEDLINDILTF